MLAGTPDFSEAIRQHQAGHVHAAAEIYRQIINSEPDHSDALHLLGVVHQQQGEHQEAIELIGRAIVLHPAKAIYHNNFGAALLSLRRFDEAIAAFAHALKIQPQYADALANRGMAFTFLNRLDEALADFNAALRIEPKHLDARRRLISLLHRMGRSGEAIELCQAAIAEQPCAEFFGKLGELLIDTGKPQAAIGPLISAIELDPRRAADRFNLGTALESLGDIPAARQQFESAATLKPSNAFWRLRAAAVAPVVLQSSDDAKSYCEQLSSSLDAWRERAPSSADMDAILAASAYPPLAIAYQGRNQRTLKEKFAAVYEPFFSNRCGMGFQPMTNMARMAMPRRRIGIVVTEHHESMFLASMRGIIERLDGERFDIVILCSQRIVETLRTRISRDGFEYVGFERSLDNAARRIHETACDMLYYWELGTDALNYFLPFLRLAPVQATGWGSTITSGVSAIDFFLSSKLIESAESQSQYTERLWNSRTLFRYQDRLPATPPAVPSDFGLPDDRHLYVCFQNPLKLHPDFDAILAGILSTDLKALIVLMSDASGHMKRLLQERFTRRIPDAGRIVFLPRQASADYCRLIQLADVVLDPVHFGAGSSCYDVFSYNLPLVTLPGELIVGQVAQACYRKMGIDDLIVHSVEKYVNRAVQVATDRDYRRFITERLAARSDVLFNDVEVVREYERFFDEALETGSLQIA